MTSTSTRPAEPFVPRWTFGDHLRKARRHSGMTQGAFAQALDTNQKTYAAWELDTTLPPNQVAIARRVELVTGVPASWLLGLDEPTPPTPDDGGVITPTSSATSARNRAVERWFEQVTGDVAERDSELLPTG